MTTNRPSSVRTIRRRYLAVSFAFAASTSALPWGCSDLSSSTSSSPADSLPTDLPEPHGARARLAAIRAHFPEPLRLSIPPRFERSEGTLVRALFARPPRSLPAGDATVELPTRASGAVRLRDNTSGLTILFALEGTQDAPVAAIDGLALYTGAFPRDGADLLHLVGPTGTEDFVFFEREPAECELRYRVDTNGVAGLRLVSNVLEFLDAGGAPRLRVRPPYVLDATGRRHAATLGVDDCAVDADPRPPWGRPVTSPGAQSCSVMVEWRGAQVQYPALVDPEWGGTMHMVAARIYHVATLLEPNDAKASRVLITGGFNALGAALDSAEFYEPLSRTFASAGSMNEARGYHTATLVEPSTDPSPKPAPQRDVLIVGGSKDQVGPPFSPSVKVEKYDQGKAEFIVLAEPQNSPDPLSKLPRVRHTATRFAPGKVLIAGGTDGPGGALGTAYIYTAGASPAITATVKPMSANRDGHAAVLLADENGSGDVLITGGIYANSAYNTGEIFSAKGIETEPFRPVKGVQGMTSPVMQWPRAFHTATWLQDGRVLLAGGTNSSSDTIVQDSAELFIKVNETWGFQRPPILMNGRQRYGHTATLLPTGVVILAGGVGAAPNGKALSDVNFVDAFEPSNNEFKIYTDLPFFGTGHAATLVNAGDSIDARKSILVTGGGAIKGSGSGGSGSSSSSGAGGSGAATGSGGAGSSGAGGGAASGSGGAGSSGAGGSGAASGSGGGGGSGGAGSGGGAGGNGAASGSGGASSTSSSSSGGAGGGQDTARNTAYLLNDLGTLCNDDHDCVSGHCVEGPSHKKVCCDRACSGLCDACLNDEKQSPTGDGVCGNAKDGTETPVTCTGGMKLKNVCNKDGQAIAVTFESCAPFQCNATGTDCANSCAEHSDCAETLGWCSKDPGAFSVPNGCPRTASLDSGSSTSTSSSAGSGGGSAVGTCLCKKPDGANCEAKEECISDLCVEHRCLTNCKTYKDCPAPLACNLEGKCVEQPNPPPLSICSTAAPGAAADRATWPALATALLASLTWLRSRRLRRRA